MEKDADVPPTAVLRPVVVVGLALLLTGSLLDLVSGAVGTRGAAAGALGDLKGVFWANQELNVWTWYSTLLLAALSGAFALTAAVHRRAGLPVADVVVFAVAAGWLSADEAAALHERLGTLARALGVHGTFEWVALGLPVALAGIAVLGIVARRTDPGLRARLAIAAVVFLGGALVLETLGGIMAETWGLGPTSLPFVLEVTVEEGLEAAGVLIALHAVLARLRILPGTTALSVGLRQGAAITAGTSERR